jgi:DNA polymerase-3 subunit beta
VKEELTGLLSIGEFARRSHLSISALRFYGDCGVLVPARIDSSTGYRYYRLEQLHEAALLRHLRALEMPIAEIQSLLNAGPAAAETALDSHWRRLERRFDQSRRALAAVQLLLHSKEKAMSATTIIEGSDLARGLRQALPAAGPLGQDRKYPAAVLIDIREDGLRLVATDGHRLVVRDLPASTTELGRTLIGPEDAARLASRAEAEGPVTVVAGAGLEVRLAGETISLPAAADDYPDYEAVLRRTGSGRLLVRSVELTARLDRGREVVVLELSRAATSADGVPFTAQYDGEDLSIGFNPAYLSDALAAGIGPDAMLQLGSPVDPVAIRSADDGTLTCLVMPIKLTLPATA